MTRGVAKDVLEGWTMSFALFLVGFLAIVGWAVLHLDNWVLLVGGLMGLFGFLTMCLLSWLIHR
jgi:hypothetical protein